MENSLNDDIQQVSSEVDEEPIASRMKDLVVSATSTVSCFFTKKQGHACINSGFDKTMPYFSDSCQFKTEHGNARHANESDTNLKLTKGAIYDSSLPFSKINWRKKLGRKYNRSKKTELKRRSCLVAPQTFRSRSAFYWDVSKIVRMIQGSGDSWTFNNITHRRNCQMRKQDGKVKVGFLNKNICLTFRE